MFKVIFPLIIGYWLVTDVQWLHCSQGHSWLTSIGFVMLAMMAATIVSGMLLSVLVGRIQKSGLFYLVMVWLATLVSMAATYGFVLGKLA